MRGLIELLGERIGLLPSLMIAFFEETFASKEGNIFLVSQPESEAKSMDVPDAFNADFGVSMISSRSSWPSSSLEDSKIVSAFLNMRNPGIFVSLQYK